VSFPPDCATNRTHARTQPTHPSASPHRFFFHDHESPVGRSFFSRRKSPFAYTRCLKRPRRCRGDFSLQGRGEDPGVSWGDRVACINGTEAQNMRHHNPPGGMIPNERNSPPQQQKRPTILFCCLGFRPTTLIRSIDQTQAAVYPGSGGGEVQCFIVPNFEELYLWQVERFGHKRKQSNDQVRPQAPIECFLPR
jgi:hypothetical protein